MVKQVTLAVVNENGEYINIVDSEGKRWSSSKKFLGDNVGKLVKGATLELNLTDKPSQFAEGYFGFPRKFGGFKGGRSEEERNEIIRQSCLGYAISTFQMKGEKHDAKEVMKLAEIYVTFVKGGVKHATEPVTQPTSINMKDVPLSDEPTYQDEEAQF